MPDPAVAGSTPRHGIFRIHVGPRIFHECCAGMRHRNGRRAGGVVVMAMRHEDAVEAGAACLQFGVELGEVARLACAGVDQRRGSAVAGDQIGVVARTGHRSRIVRPEENRRKHAKTILEGAATGGVYTPQVPPNAIVTVPSVSTITGTARRPLLKVNIRSRSAGFFLTLM